jgi:hypothetical protein
MLQTPTWQIFNKIYQVGGRGLVGCGAEDTINIFFGES